MQWFTRTAAPLPGMEQPTSSEWSESGDNTFQELSRALGEQRGQQVWKLHSELTNQPSPEALPHIQKINATQEQIDQMPSGTPQVQRAWEQWATEVELAHETFVATQEMGDVSWDDPEITQQDPAEEEDPWAGAFGSTDRETKMAGILDIVGSSVSEGVATALQNLEALITKALGRTPQKAHAIRALDELAKQLMLGDAGVTQQDAAPEQRPTPSPIPARAFESASHEDVHWG